MVIVGGADKAVKGDIDGFLFRFVSLSDLVDKFFFFAFKSGGFGRFFHFSAVLVRACKEINFLSKQAVISGQSVGNNFLVDMADMNRVVGIVNGGGYVKFVVHERNFNLK